MTRAEGRPGGLFSPRLWATEPTISLSEVHHRVTTARVWPGVWVTAVDGLLPQTPLVTYLEWRRGLRPANFDHYHPRLGPMLAMDETLRSALVAPQKLVTANLVTHPATPPCDLVPTAGVSTPAVEPRLSSQQVVPEPGTATIALAMVGSAALAGRARRRSGGD